MAVFTCLSKNGTAFDVRPRGSADIRKKWFQDKEKLIGKKLTVRFQNYSAYGIPIFPVGLTIRDYE
jgi:DNA ligase-1